MSKKSIAEKIKKVFRVSGKTQEEIADMLGVSQHQVSNYATGKSQPPLDVFEKIIQMQESRDANYFFEPTIKISHSGTGDIVGRDKITSSSDVELLKKENEILKLKLELSKKKK